MTLKVIDKHTAPHYTWGNKCDSWVLADTDVLSAKEESMPPGTRKKLLFHPHAQQFFYILDGVATFYLKGEKEVLQARQGFYITPHPEHYIANEGDGTLSFLVISQPTTTHDRTTLEK